MNKIKFTFYVLSVASLILNAPATKAASVNTTPLLPTDQKTYFDTNSNVSGNANYLGAYVIESKGDKLYLGYSANVPTHDNNGPFVSYYKNGAFTKISILPEQDIFRMKVFDDKLYIPGLDPNTLAWDAGNFMIIDTTTDTFTLLDYKYDNLHFVDATTTDANGNYSFENLKNTTFTLKIINPRDYSFRNVVTMYSQNLINNDFNTSGEATICGVVNNVGIRFTEEINNDAVDAGLVPSPGTAAGTANLSDPVDSTYYSGSQTIGDLVWEDTDNDGLQDTDEPGIEGVRVELYTKDPFFPCIIHMNGVWKKDGVIYASGGFIRATDTVHDYRPSYEYYYRNNELGNLIVTSEDEGVTWEILAEYPGWYYPYDIAFNNNYFYMTSSEDLYGTWHAGQAQDADSTNLILYTKDFVNWNELVATQSTRTPFTDEYDSDYNVSKAIFSPLSALITFRGNFIFPGSETDEIVRLDNNHNFEIIKTQTNLFSDLFPAFDVGWYTYFSDALSGHDQSYNTLAIAEDEYLYAIGGNKIYLTTNLRGWEEVADFDTIDSGAQLISLHYWEDQNLLVASTAGQNGDIYTLSHADAVNQAIKKPTDNSDLEFYDNYENVNLETIGSTGTTTVKVFENSLKLADFGTNFSCTNWSYITGDNKDTESKAFISTTQKTGCNGIVEKLYLPVGQPNPKLVRLCPNVKSLGEINADCPGGDWLAPGETKTINSIKVSLSQNTIGGKTYMIVTNAGGFGGQVLYATSSTTTPTSTPTPTSTATNQTNTINEPSSTKNKLLTPSSPESPAPQATSSSIISTKHLPTILAPLATLLTLLKLIATQITQFIRSSNLPG